jgi:MoxR-like ATPase
LPVPKYKGNLLDPPLRSRFQAHLVSYPSYDDYNKYLNSLYKNVEPNLVKNLCDFGYSFYTNEMISLNLPDFPIENIDKIVKIIDKCCKDEKNHLKLNKLINKIYPHEFILKDETTNRKFYFELMKKFDLINKDQFNKSISTSKDSKRTFENDIDYEFISIENNDSNTKKLKFKSNNKLISINLNRGTNSKEREDSKSSFIMNDYHSSQLVDMMLNHSSGYDFCLIGAQGSGKTELIKQFANMLDYNLQTVYVYKDMNARDLLQQRITLSNGDTQWQNSTLVEAAVNGDLAVLDGIHRLKDDTIMSLRRLIQDRDVDLLDGTKLLAHDKFDSLMADLKKNNQVLSSKVLRIHPSFRIIATAEPPLAKGVLKSQSDSNDNIPSANKSTSSNNTEWLNSEVLNLFLYQSIEPLEVKYEYEILNKKFKLNDKHEKLLNLMEQLKQSGQEENQLKHVASLFSLRKLIKLSYKLEKYPSLNLRELIENASLFKFMPQLNKQILNEFLDKNQLTLDFNNDLANLSLHELQNKYIQTNQNSESLAKKDEDSILNELSKIPDTLFFENKLHTIILNNLIRDFELGEHLLLIGNQGTGKNKLTDKFLMLTKKPREYIQLHRDTTVHSLTVQPVIRSGKIHYEDSPLVKAVKNGHIIVIDEADKAPLHVTCILKSLIESGEMTLSDGRRIVSSNYKIKTSDSEKFIRMHKDFRMIILANRPGFPFLGNDFFAILGDLLSCHPIGKFIKF